jgi:hypothetical protein
MERIPAGHCGGCARRGGVAWCTLGWSTGVGGEEVLVLRERMRGRVWWSLNAELRRTLVEWVFLEMKDDGSELREG